MRYRIKKKAALIKAGQCNNNRYCNGDLYSIQQKQQVIFGSLLSQLALSNGGTIIIKLFTVPLLFN